MRVIHQKPFQPHEIETFRQLTFDNLTRGLKSVLEAMEDMELEVTPENAEHVELITNARDIGDGEPFPMEYYEPLKRLWADESVQKAWERGNEAALPEK
jgi:guanine nucleotide-binding protein subunit alpha, other